MKSVGLWFRQEQRAVLYIPPVGPLAPIAETLTNASGLDHQGMPIFDSTNFRRVRNKIWGELGFEVFDKKTLRYHGLRPHDFRRSAARNLVRAGVPETVAQKIASHQDGQHVQAV